MNTFLQCDWNDILEGKSAVQQFDIFMTKFNEAKKQIYTTYEYKSQQQS
jgi:hypothetical protein